MKTMDNPLNRTFAFPNAPRRAAKSKPSDKRRKAPKCEVGYPAVSWRRGHRKARRKVDIATGRAELAYQADGCAGEHAHGRLGTSDCEHVLHAPDDGVHPVPNMPDSDVLPDPLAAIGPWLSCC